MSTFTEETFRPTDITLHSVSRIMEIRFENDEVFNLPYEYLRVYTPSAEALGHGMGDKILQIHKEQVTIKEIKPIGNYGISPVFSDGHNSGIYTWNFLYKLGSEYTVLWADYLHQLQLTGIQRNTTTE